MAKRTIYRYDPVACAYVPEKRNARFFLRRYGPLTVLGLGMAAALVWGFFAVYDSPETKRLKNEHAALVKLTEDSKRLNARYALAIDSLKEAEKAIYRKALNAEPEEEQAQKDGKLKRVAVDRANLDELESRLENLNRQLKQNDYTSQALLDLAKLNAEELRQIPSIRPVNGEVISGHGLRKNPITKQDKQHNGVDLRADLHTPVRATGDGVVHETGSAKNGRGLYIVIRHARGYETWYSHLAEVKVYRGKRVKRGDVIGLSGNTGLCKGPHLHYEVVQNGRSVDPIDYFYADLNPDEFASYRKKANQYNESMN